jgi:hypothetical protein
MVYFVTVQHTTVALHKSDQGIPLHVSKQLSVGRAGLWHRSCLHISFLTLGCIGTTDTDSQSHGFFFEGVAGSNTLWMHLLHHTA